MRKRIVLCFVVLASLVAFAANSENSIRKSIEIVAKVYNIIIKNYVSEVDDKKLVEGAISGMLAALDPHSSYFDEKELKDLDEHLSGEFSGVGFVVSQEYKRGLRVISPIDDSPAFKVGIKPGDLIVAINDEPISAMSNEDSVRKIRGPKGVKVKLTILREGEPSTLEFEVARDVIKTKSVKSRMYDDIGYLRISSFGHNTIEELLNEIKTLQGQKSQAYIIDLRNNPGGILQQAVEVSSAFLQKDVDVVSIKSRDKTNVSYKSESTGPLANAPLVVMINEGSASASEIVAGALQDHKRAIILGTKSFGKGSVQGRVDLGVVGYGGFKLTTSLYYTPKGRSIQADGIVPDLIVKPAKIEFAKMGSDLRSESTLMNHIKNETSDRKVVEDYKKLVDANNKKELDSLYEKDYQLARAIDVVKTIEFLGVKTHEK